MISKSIVLFITICLSYSSFTQPKPTDVYSSEKVYFARFLNKSQSSERFRLIKHGEGMYRFVFNQNSVNIHQKITSEFKILKIKKDKNEIKYLLIDNQQNQVVLTFHIDDELQQHNKVNISLITYDKAGLPISTSEIACKKI